jgi:sporulation protein YlmC with PRC-barrel domain
MGLGLVLAVAQERKVEVQVQPPEGEKVEVRGDASDPPGFYRATEMIGMPVKGEGNEQLGVVRDLVIDGDTQEVRYLLLSEGEAVATTDEWVAVPFSVVQPHFIVDGGDPFFFVAFNRQRFVDAPRIRAADLRNFRNVDWMVGTDRFFGVNVRIGDRDRRDRRDGASRRDRDRGRNSDASPDRRGDTNRDADTTRDSDATRDSGTKRDSATKSRDTAPSKREAAPKTAPKAEPKTAPKAEPKQSPPAGKPAPAPKSEK